ncbi:oligosaccharide flippase family protein [Hydrogenophaga sp. ZJX-1]|uniref:oligosaccharide flippase family protein n=1 Tax=Hydrogenophaga sp. ZJX-1 TaxID=3404778 RepID=UPI003B28580D
MKFSSKVVVTFWSAVLQWARVGTNALVFLVLTRWLSLPEIGVVAAVQAPVIIAQAFVTTMIPDFVVQERRLNQGHSSTLFWLSLAIGLVLTIALVAATPLIVAPLSNPNANSYLLALSLCPLIWSVGTVFEGLQRRALRTKKLAVRTGIASLLAGSVAVTMGYFGFSSWSLIAFTLVNAVIATVVLILSSSWRPSVTFRWRYIQLRLRTLLALGGRHLLGAAALPILQYTTAVQLGTTGAGILQIALRVFSLLDTLILAPYRFVVLPLFSRAKSDEGWIQSNLLRTITFACLIVIPVQIGAIIMAPILLPLAIGYSNGSQAVGALQFLCIYGLLAAPINVVNQVLLARGFSTQIFRRSLMMYALAVFPAALAARYSVEAVTLTYGLCGGLGGFVVTLLLLRKLLNVPIKPIVMAWLRVTLSAILMLFACLGYLFPSDLSPWIRLVVIFGLGVGFYFIGCLIFARDLLMDLLKTIKPRRTQRTDK